MNRTGLVIALGVAATAGLIFGARPDLDLELAGLFFDPERGGFWRSYDPVYLRARDVSIWLVALVVMPAVFALMIKLVFPHRPLLISGRAILLIHATVALGPGVVTNFILKDHWARPRPIDVAQFGGEEHFRPWWDPRGDCSKNCSFIAGEPSGAYWTLAPAALVPPQWRLLAYGTALAFGSAVGVLRMAAGAHFFADVVFAGVLMFLVIWFTHGWFYRWHATRISDESVERMIERVRIDGTI
jgi:lipid A 4'-phosphatase